MGKTGLYFEKSSPNWRDFASVFVHPNSHHPQLMVSLSPKAILCWQWYFSLPCNIEYAQKQRQPHICDHIVLSWRGVPHIDHITILKGCTSYWSYYYLEGVHLILIILLSWRGAPHTGINCIFLFLNYYVLDILQYIFINLCNLYITTKLCISHTMYFI